MTIGGGYDSLKKVHDVMHAELRDDKGDDKGEGGLLVWGRG